MEPKFWADLKDVLQNWVNDICEEDDWIALNVIVGDETVNMMALAAWCVLRACAESQNYAISEGYLNEG